MTNYTRVQIRRGTAAQWALDNPVLAAGEQTLEIDTLKTKFGDGIKTYSELPYQDQQGPQGIQGEQGIQGIQGPKGDTGSFGGAVFTYNYLTDTVDSNPGSGNLKFNNTLTTATQLYINKVDINSIDNGAYLETIDDSTSAIKGHFRVEEIGTPENFVYYAINGSHYLDASAYYEVPIMYLSGSISTLANNADVTITFVRTGDKGDQGIQGIQGEQGIQGIQGIQGEKGDTGSSMIDWHGTWSASTTYPANSIVYYNGNTYIAIQIAPPPGDIGANPETLTAYWSLFSSKGDAGPQGIQGIQGIQGVKGDTGSAGPAGADAPTIISVEEQGTTTYTLSLTDKDKLIMLSNASSISLKIPTAVSVAFPVGSAIYLVQSGVGQVTVSAVSPGTTTINATPGYKLRATWSQASLIKIGTETWLLGGDLVV